VNDKVKSELYFIAIIPPSPVKEEVWKMKEHMSESYKSHAALRSPPHITMHMPFRWNPRKETGLIESLETAVGGIRPFLLELNGFDAFTPRVIYIHVNKTDDLQAAYNTIRRAMQVNLHDDNADYKKRGFIPHLTLAFRDLRKAAFHEAWIEFSHKEYTASWLVESVVVLKHTGRRWEAFYTLPFSRGCL
jgi:2'-5' RNA ligase